MDSGFKGREMDFVFLGRSGGFFGRSGFRGRFVVRFSDFSLFVFSVFFVVFLDVCGMV